MFCFCCDYVLDGYTLNTCICCHGDLLTAKETSVLSSCYMYLLKWHMLLLRKTFLCIIDNFDILIIFLGLQR